MILNVGKQPYLEGVPSLIPGKQKGLDMYILNNLF